MFLDQAHEVRFMELTNDDNFLNKGQSFILAFDLRLYKLFSAHMKGNSVNWSDLFKDESLSSDEKMLFSLMKSFEGKDSSEFSIQDLYKISNMDYLKLALNSLQAHFSLDIYPYTYRAAKQTHSVIRETIKSEYTYPIPEEKLISQKEIADLLNLNGINGDRRKVNVYKSRGLLPEPDLKTNNGDLWKESAIKEWIQNYANGKIVQRRNIN